MSNLERRDQIHLNAAQGWIGLGNFIEANSELDEITPELRAHPDVLEARWHICAHSKKWEGSLDIAEAVIQKDAHRQAAWIHRSFALHELNRTQEAFDKLLAAAKLFPKVWIVPYNLACYCSQLFRLDEAKDWFIKAMEIDEKASKAEALDDPDLKPLWDSMSGTIWTKE